MSRCVYAAVAFSLTSFAFGQATPSLQLAPPAAQNLLKDPSFEEPPVQARLSAKEGGDLTKAGEAKTNWAHFQVFQADKEGEGKFTIGLTNEFARTGKQSLYVDLDKVTGINRRSFLMSELLPIKPGEAYRVSIWGRTDKKHPLTLDQRLMLMKMEFEFFTPDMEDQAGDTQHRTLLVPGNSKRIYFVSNKWTAYQADVRAPRDAGWMKVTFRWETGREKGMTDGTIYFDDASVTHLPGGQTLIPIDESDAKKPEPEEGTETETGEAAAPAAPPAGAKPPEKK